MKRNKFPPASAQQQQHLPLAVLRRYQEGVLPAPEEHRVERHLLGCDLCSDVLSGMAGQSAAQTASAAHQINQRLAAARAAQQSRVIPLFSRRNMAVAATLLLLLCSAGVVFFYNLQQVQQKEGVPVAVTIPGPVQPELPVLRPAAPGAAPAPTKAENQVAAAKPAPNRQSGPAAPRAETLLVDAGEAATISSEQATRETAPDSGLVSTQAVAAAPAPLPGSLAGDVASPAAKMATGIQSRRMAVAPMVLNVKTIHGRVLSSDGEALPGVSVVMKGMREGVVTDAGGRYTLPVPETAVEVVLVYQFIGYQPLEKKVSPGSQAAVEVALTADTRALSEVVVVDYGKKSGAGSAADASPAGGWSGYKKYLQMNLQQPPATGRKKSGRVVVGFTVHPNGSLADVRVIKSLSPAADAEVLRLVQQGPAWQPAKAGDTAVPQQVRVSIRFSGKE
jgi:TonB family protein